MRPKTHALADVPSAVLAPQESCLHMFCSGGQCGIPPDRRGTISEDKLQVILNVTPEWYKKEQQQVSLTLAICHGHQRC